MIATTAKASGFRIWRDALSRQEIAQLLEMNDVHTWAALATNWGIVAGAFAVVAWLPNPLTILLALFLIGGRQLGFSVLMHEAAHHTLLRDRKWNDWVGRWLSAYPVWSDMRAYRPYHLQHHSKNWTDEDPDLGLATPFPVTRASMRRKIWRDLTGRTGWKRARATLKRDRALTKMRRAQGDAQIGPIGGMLITNAVLLAALTVFGHPELYLLWVAAWFTTYSLIMRIRAIAEHAMAPDPTDPLQNTRTTLASWWERLLVAPNRVNYHLEHHLLMTVPHYNLPRMHRLLRERSILGQANITRGYAAVLRLASSKPAGAEAPVRAAPPPPEVPF